MVNFILPAALAEAPAAGKTGVRRHSTSGAWALASDS